MKTTKTVQGKIDPLNFLQLSIFDLPVQDTPTKLRYPNPKKAQKFRDLADRM
ncbi:DNA-methyltransferase-like protein [Crocosphaera watsonii WH 0401]|nr:DNA-methyltransferase-like protein [Crocosphaera watsonii WH 0401]